MDINDQNENPRDGLRIFDDPAVLAYARNTGPRLTSAPRSVFLEMARHVKPDTGHCCPT